MRPRSNQSRRSIRAFPSLSHERADNLNVHMFTEDVHLGVMPIGGWRLGDREFRVVFKGTEKARDRAEILLSSLARYGSDDPARLICDVVNEIALYLAWRGRAVYELVTDEMKGKGDCEISLHDFTSERLIQVPGFYVQRVPRPDREQFKRRFVFIPSREVWEVSMPLCLGGARGYGTMLCRLARFDTVGPDFYRTDLERGRWEPYLDFGSYVRIMEARAARLTKLWGWNRRDANLEGQTEFFYFYRTITFAWAKAVLREHIVRELNRLLGRLGIESRVVVSGLPSPDEILGVRRELLEGKVQFGEAYERTKT